MIKPALRSVIYLASSIATVLGIRWIIYRIMCWYRMRKFLKYISRNEK